MFVRVCVCVCVCVCMQGTHTLGTKLNLLTTINNKKKPYTYSLVRDRGAWFRYEVGMNTYTHTYVIQTYMHTYTHTYEVGEGQVLGLAWFRYELVELV